MAVAEKTETGGAEPTMEEILASIRRIISEDGATVEAAPPPADSVLDLTEMMEAEAAAAAPPPPLPLPPEPPAALEVVMEDNVPDMPVPEIPAALPETPAGGSDDRLVSEMTAQAAASVISSVMPQQAGGGLPMGNGGRTLESMVMELIRPVLKEWLDRNLPALVERVVQKEIRKITRDV
jgi:cell pole-organizing protein PopZ